MARVPSAAERTFIDLVGGLNRREVR